MMLVAADTFSGTIQIWRSIDPILSSSLFLPGVVSGDAMISMQHASECSVPVIVRPAKAVPRTVPSRKLRKKRLISKGDEDSGPWYGGEDEVWFGGDDGFGGHGGSGDWGNGGGGHGGDGWQEGDSWRKQTGAIIIAYQLVCCLCFATCTYHVLKTALMRLQGGEEMSSDYNFACCSNCFAAHGCISSVTSHSQA